MRNLMRIKTLLATPIILIIKLYQIIISPLLGSNCRYQPTCSQYSVQALKEWGIFYGLFLSLKRIVRCHPWGDSGYDPVPPKSKL